MTQPDDDPQATSRAPDATPGLAPGRVLRYPQRAMRPARLARKSLPAVALAWLTVLAFAWGAWAQEPSPGAAAEPARPLPLPIAAEDVVARASETQRALYDLAARAAPVPEVEAIAERLAEVQDRWTRDAADTLRRLEHRTSRTFLDETERVWSARDRQLVDWNAALRKRAGALASDLTQIDGSRDLWQRTLVAERDEQLPQALRQTIRQVLDSVEATRSSVRKRRDAVLALQASVLQERQRVVAVTEAVSAAREQLLSQLFLRDAPPLWSRGAYDRSGEAIERVESAWRDLAEAFGIYVSEHADDLALFALALIALVALITVLGRRAARWTAEEQGAAATARVLGRPVSAALLVLLVAYPVILPAAPLLLRWVAAVVVLVPALRLLAPLLEGAPRRALYLLSGWFAVDALRILVDSAHVLVRLLLLLEAAAALALMVWLLRSGRLRLLRGSPGGKRVLRAGLRIASVLLAISLLSNAVGNSSLAELMVVGTLRGAYAGVLLQGSGLVLQELWGVLLHTPALRRLRAVQRHEALLRRRGATLVRWGLAFTWLWLTLGFFQLLDPFRGAVGAVLGATWPLGEVAFSLGDLVAFGITIWLAIWLSRFVRFVLDEDVLPRTRLPRGVPYAISSGVHYVILLLGFLMAVAAAGFDMSRFALIVGALGVGIGIGLQDVVNNFVSGLILLFERPVQTGDTVQVGDILGEVRRIGMRSSTVRTWSGAEVIVPNSKLVSDNVVNWTLSDNLRRVEIAIGVAYGTDPERVLALLSDVARAHPNVLAEPEPSALFQAHGESSLDFELRAWTASGDWITVKSDLTVAINRALRDAGIEIPFPQRDLHLRSVDPEVRGALREPSGGGSGS